MAILFMVSFTDRFFDRLYGSSPLPSAACRVVMDHLDDLNRKDIALILKTGFATIIDLSRKERNVLSWTD